MRYLLTCGKCRVIRDSADILNPDEYALLSAPTQPCANCQEPMTWILDVAGSKESGQLRDVAMVVKRRTEASAQLKAMRGELMGCLDVRCASRSEHGFKVGRTSGAGIRALLATIVQRGIEMLTRNLGCNPPCAFACIVFGSTARDDGGAYPDLDYAFLVDDESEASIDYFEMLAQHVGDAIHMLGEATVGESYGLHSCYGGASPLFQNFGWRYRDTEFEVKLDELLEQLMYQLDKAIHGVDSAMQVTLADRANVEQLEREYEVTQTKIAEVAELAQKARAMKTGAIETLKSHPEKESEIAPFLAQLVELLKQIKAEKQGLSARSHAMLAARADIQRDRARRILAVVQAAIQQRAHFAPWLQNIIVQLASVLRKLDETRWLAHEHRRVNDQLHSVYSHASRQRTRGTVTLIATPESLAQWARPDKDKLLEDTARRIAAKQEMHPKSRFFLRQIANPGDYCDFVSIVSEDFGLVERLFKARHQILQGAPACANITTKLSPEHTITITCHTRAQELFAKVIIENAQACHVDIKDLITIDVKKGLWRFPQTLIAFLCQLHAIPQMNSFSRIQELVQRGVLSGDLGHRLADVYAYLVTLRVRCHRHYKCELHTVFIGQPVADPTISVKRNACVAAIDKMHSDLAALRKRMFENRPDENDFVQLFQLESMGFGLYKELDSLNQALAQVNGLVLTADDLEYITGVVCPLLAHLKTTTFAFVTRGDWKQFG